MQIKANQLTNGIKVVHQYLPQSNVSHCGLVFKFGSRDENTDEHGMAHFIEHCLFKGTSKRKAFHVLSRLDAVGGELNAYTTKEELCIYASFINEHYDRAIELLTDIAFNSLFPDKEIEKEKDVIVDEINSYLDNPVETIFEDFETVLYPNHPLGNTILGTPESIAKFNKEGLINMMQRVISTSEIVFSSVGNLTFVKFEKLIDKYLKNIPVKISNYSRIAIEEKQVKIVEQKKSINQIHVLMGIPTYGLKDDNRKSLVLLANILGGGGMNNRLNMNIREKYGYTYSIEANYTSYVDIGNFNIYYSSEAKNRKKIDLLIQKELKKLQFDRMSEMSFELAKKQLKGHIALSNESRSGNMLSSAKSLLYFDEIDTLEEVYKKIDEITANQLLEMAREVLNYDKFCQLIFVPEN